VVDYGNITVNGGECAIHVHFSPPLRPFCPRRPAKMPGARCD
jgi:hypothetical protein